MEILPGFRLFSEQPFTQCPNHWLWVALGCLGPFHATFGATNYLVFMVTSAKLSMKSIENFKAISHDVGPFLNRQLLHFRYEAKLALVELCNLHGAALCYFLYLGRSNK